MDEADTPDPVAALDQAMASMSALADLLMAHFAAMLTAGFSADQAFALTLSYQATLVAKLHA